MKLNRLIPMLPVRSMPVSVEFYQNMLGFKVERRNDDWGWAMLCFDECRLMVDQSINAHPEAPRQSILYLYPDSVVEYHKQVRKNGLAVPELEITFYGLTEFRISDPDGNRLWVIQMGIACGSVRTRLLEPNNVLKGRRVKRARP
jgi:uncharacterized glyoxalase superfamily protein PhnB